MALALNFDGLMLDLLQQFDGFLDALTLGHSRHSQFPPPLKGLGFLNDLFYGRRYIAAPAELSIPFLLDEKSTVVPVRLAGEQSGGKRKVSYGDARSNSEQAAPAAWVGKRFSAPQIV